MTSQQLRLLKRKYIDIPWEGEIQRRKIVVYLIN